MWVPEFQSAGPGDSTVSKEDISMVPGKVSGVRWTVEQRKSSVQQDRASSGQGQRTSACMEKHSGVWSSAVSVVARSLPQLCL